MKTYSNDLGVIFESEKFFCFFGNKNSHLCLDTETILFGKQTHDTVLSKVVFKPEYTQTTTYSSDGQYTKNKNLKLGLYTADCLPCFIITESQLFSLHLGWKGVLDGLFDKAIKKINKNEKLNIFVGPHIQKESFEIGEDLKKMFKKSTAHSLQKKWFLEKSNGRTHLSLIEVLKTKANGYEATFHTSEIDALKSANHYSYRGDDKTKSRNISFAFLKF